MADSRFVETKMRSGPGHSALAGEIILHDSNAKFQCVIGFAHKSAPYSVGVQLLGCSSIMTGKLVRVNRHTAILY